MFFGCQLGKLFHVGLGNRVISQQNVVSEIDYLDVLVLELSSLCFREPFDTFMHRSLKEQITIQRMKCISCNAFCQLDSDLPAL